jgi:glyoxylase-like metal-dependent hydrolase (beta-lactamase superfamily II)
MQVERLRFGPWGENCFLITQDTCALLIDPGGRADDILRILSERKLDLCAILNTHGHFDHIGAVMSIVGATGAPFYLSERERPILKTTNMLRFIFKSREKFDTPTEFVDIDLLPETFELGVFTIRKIETPGHTPGGHCFLIDDHIFSGDTVLSSMPGTAELPGGNREDLVRSLKLLASLPDDLILHPGHGSDTTLSGALASVASLDVSQPPLNRNET